MVNGNVRSNISNNHPVLHVCHHQRRGGRVLNVSSVAGLYAYPGTNASQEITTFFVKCLENDCEMVVKWFWNDYEMIVILMIIFNSRPFCLLRNEARHWGIHPGAIFSSHFYKNL